MTLDQRQDLTTLARTTLAGLASSDFWHSAAVTREALRAKHLRRHGYVTDVAASAETHARADAMAQGVLLRHATFLRLVELAGPSSRRNVLDAWDAATDAALHHLQALGVHTPTGAPLSASSLEETAHV